MINKLKTKEDSNKFLKQSSDNVLTFTTVVSYLKI